MFLEFPRSQLWFIKSLLDIWQIEGREPLKLRLVLKSLVGVLSRGHRSTQAVPVRGPQDPPFGWEEGVLLVLVLGITASVHLRR